MARNGDNEEGGEEEEASPGSMLGQFEAEVENPRTYMEWKEATLEKVQQLS